MSLPRKLVRILLNMRLHGRTPINFGGVTLLLLVSAFARSATAQLPTLSEQYRYRAVDQTLPDALRAFAWDQRLHLVLDPEIPSHKISDQAEMPPEQFLDYMTHKYGLIWYFDGTSLYIYPGSRLVTYPFTLTGTTAGKVKQALNHLNAYSNAYPFRVMGEQNVMLVVGPPRYLEMIQFVIRALEAESRRVSNEVSIAVFPLVYASATDQTLEFQGRSVTVRGVASILQGIVSGEQDNSSLSTYMPRKRTGLTGQGLNRFSPPEQGTDADAMKAFQALSQRKSTDGLPNETPVGANQFGGQPYGPPSEFVHDTPVGPNQVFSNATVTASVHADTRINAVIVKDLPQRMPIYKRLIEQLDRPSNLVEITAQIIDITKEGVFEWGLPMDLQSKDGANQISAQLSSTDAANVALTLVQNDATKFLAKVKALEQEGYARVASRPSILTMDNVEAEIENSETFFVRVEGDFEVELFDVSIGTTLNILPHIVNNENGRFVSLRVDVEDGAVLEQTVDEIPRVRNDSITTQAILGEGQSLLIGGLFREEQSESVSQLPLLGHLPAVGKLFQTREYNKSRVERVILLEPRVVPLPIPSPTAGAVLFEDGCLRLSDGAMAWPSSDAAMGQGMIEGGHLLANPALPCIPQQCDSQSPAASSIPAAPVVPTAPLVPTASEELPPPVETTLVKPKPKSSRRTALPAPVRIEPI
ncbi:type III secretion system outer membrane ring subunit SctC [Roseiconus lacunae]|uniref:type III secretion system outer membrane ring subunit SctC n=1 Tax=Roseiconus lacunae TaxID=2605694 RepID=UPI001E42665A|nr:type III secretion system outer membrane ring subunit SctC [Roseiconus lacunae]MCD0457892.1 type III secretion system outer membrane ring subunit SctC [Roseiconus lacunae]